MRRVFIEYFFVYNGTFYVFLNNIIWSFKDIIIQIDLIVIEKLVVYIVTLSWLKAILLFYPGL